MLAPYLTLFLKLYNISTENESIGYLSIWQPLSDIIPLSVRLLCGTQQEVIYVCFTFVLTLALIKWDYMYRRGVLSVLLIFNLIHALMQ